MSISPSIKLNRLRDQLKPLGDQYKEWKKQVPILQDLIVKAHLAGMKQAELVELTGYARDNIRLLCMPDEKREELRRRRRVGTDQVALAAAEAAAGSSDPAVSLRGGMESAARRRGSRTKRT